MITSSKIVFKLPETLSFKKSCESDVKIWGVLPGACWGRVVGEASCLEGAGGHSLASLTAKHVHLKFVFFLGGTSRKRGEKEGDGFTG